MYTYQNATLLEIVCTGSYFDLDLPYERSNLIPNVFTSDTSWNVHFFFKNRSRNYHTYVRCLT